MEETHEKLEAALKKFGAPHFFWVPDKLILLYVLVMKRFLDFHRKLISF